MEHASPRRGLRFGPGSDTHHLSNRFAAASHKAVGIGHYEPGLVRGIRIKIENAPIVVPPAPFNPNPGFVVPQKTTTVDEKHSGLAAIPATTTIDQLVRALNALGVTPRDLIAILQAMHTAGMISADIEVQ